MSNENELMGKKFMYLGLEYEIIYINDQKKRLNIKPIKKDTNMPTIGQKFEIDMVPFLVTYIHEGKRSITLSPMIPDDFLKNNKGEKTNEQ